MGVLTKVFGTKHEREVKRLQPKVDAINALEARFEALSDEQLREKTVEFRAQLETGTALDDLLVPAFAVTREAAKRVLGMRHYDVQLVGGIVLHQGKIAEMKTGEGKTLVATLPVYLNALTGRGVHVVTVNDYLAQRDAQWMGQVYRFLGLEVGCIVHGLDPDDRRRAYAADVTYGTNNEIGFDYLRDNMAISRDRMVQREHHYAIVDEVDSILVDEARTPLIISGPSEESVDKYYSIDRIIPKLERGEEIEEGDHKYTTGDFIIDEKNHTATLTEEGAEKVEKILGIGNLFDMENVEILHGVNQGLRAHHLYKRDVNYLVMDGQVVIVDEFTGRMMPGRRWSDGLHQAVEAKEGVKIEQENQTLATITYQNLFRGYEKLAGMTGTADTEATEFGEIYKLEVVVIPTNLPIARDDREDFIFGTTPEKWNAVADEIEECQAKGQPVLVGTVSIEKSEMISKLLKKRRVPHVVLNAKHHQKEASIVAQAGRLGSVTIATNMAGRGTDIVLGGNAEQLAAMEADPQEDPEGHAAALAKLEVSTKEEREKVLEAGGLHILGTERHESRRIDNQLRGRSGRQGDPGSSRFFLSLEDDLMRIFANERMQALMQRWGLEDGVPIESRMVSRAIESAQTKVEARNFEIRKNLLEYDDVMNMQREAIYGLRRDVLDGKEGRDYILRTARDVVDYIIESNCPEKDDPADWDLASVHNEVTAYFDVDVSEIANEPGQYGTEDLQELIWERSLARYEEKENEYDEEDWRWAEKRVLLTTIDRSWKDHLLALDHLREGIGLRGYAQRDPKNEYKRESYDLFQSMKERIEDTALKTIWRLQPITSEQREELARRMRQRPRGLTLNKPAVAGMAGVSTDTAPSSGQPPQIRNQAAAGGGTPGPPVTIVRNEPKVGRNEPCPCGSGKKYKKCHGRA